MTERLTIGYFDDSRSHGGTTQYLLEILGDLDRNRFHPVFFAPDPREWHQDLIKRGVEIVSLTRKAAMETASPAPSASVSAPDSQGASSRRPRLPRNIAWHAGLARDLAQLTQLFRMRQVDLLHLNNAGAEPAPIAGRLAGVPAVVGTWHVESNYDLFGERQGLNYRLLERVSMRSLHHAIPVSEATMRDWVDQCGLGESYRKNRVTVIHNGIDPGRVQRRRSVAEAKAAFGIESGTVIIGSAGRLASAKGYEFLIRALPDMVRQNPGIQVVIAGSGPLEAELRALAQEVGVDKSIRFLGFVNDVRSVLECMDIYVQPSLCEAFTIAILEASAVGLPIVASNVGGVAECVIDGSTGYVVPARNPEALAKALLPLVRDANLRKEMGERGRVRTLENFTRDQMVAKTIAVYERVLTGKRSSRTGWEPALGMRP